MWFHFQASTLDLRALFTRQSAVQILANNIRFSDWVHRIRRRRSHVLICQRSPDFLDQLGRKTTLSNLLAQSLGVLLFQCVVEIGQQCSESQSHVNIPLKW